MSTKALYGLLLLFAAVTLALGLQSLLAPPATEAQTAGPFSYAVKFVCGFNPSNAGPPSPDIFGHRVGENVVKLGNYATEINIYNPAETQSANIRKKIAVLVRNDPATGGTDLFVREPDAAPADEFIRFDLAPMNATMDDCNELYRRAGIPNPVAPAPLMVGILAFVSDMPLDITSVYTSEICSDWIQGVGGAGFMCSNQTAGTAGAFWGAGISIDVEQVRGRDLSRMTP